MMWKVWNKKKGRKEGRRQLWLHMGFTVVVWRSRGRWVILGLRGESVWQHMSWAKKVNDKSTVCSCLQCKLPFVKVAVICMREERKRKREEGPWSVLSSSSFGFIITRTLWQSSSSSSSPVVLMGKALKLLCMLQLLLQLLLHACNKL